MMLSSENARSPSSNRPRSAMVKARSVPKLKAFKVQVKRRTNDEIQNLGMIESVTISKMNSFRDEMVPPIELNSLNSEMYGSFLTEAHVTPSSNTSSRIYDEVRAGPMAVETSVTISPIRSTSSESNRYVGGMVTTPPELPPRSYSQNSNRKKKKKTVTVPTRRVKSSLSDRSTMKRSDSSPGFSRSDTPDENLTVSARSFFLKRSDSTGKRPRSAPAKNKLQNCLVISSRNSDSKTIKSAQELMENFSSHSIHAMRAFLSKSQDDPDMVFSHEVPETPREEIEAKEIRSPMFIPHDQSRKVKAVNAMKKSLMTSKAKTSVFVTPFSTLSGSMKSLKKYKQEQAETDHALVLHRAKIRKMLKDYIRDIEKHVSLERRIRVYQRISSMADSLFEDVSIVIRTSGMLMNLMSRLRNDHMDALNVHYEESKHLLKVLAKLCKDEDNKEIFRKERGIFKLVEILKNARAIFLRDHTYHELISQLITGDPLARKEYRDYGGMEEILTLLTQAKGQLEKMELLSLLFDRLIPLDDEQVLSLEETKAREKDIESFVSAGGVLILVDLFSQGFDSIHESCGIRLAQLCKLSSVVQDTIHELNAIQLYIEYIMNKPNTNMVQAVQSICKNHAPNQALFRDLDGFQVLEKILTSLQFAQLKTSTIDAIATICQDNLENLDYINKTGLVAVIRDLAEIDLLQNSVAKAVVTLCSNHSFNQNVMGPAIKTFASIIQNIDIICIHPSENYTEIIENSAHAIVVLCSNNEHNYRHATKVIEIQSIYRVLKLLSPSSPQYFYVFKLYKLFNR